MAADRRATNQGTVSIVTKIRRINGNLVGASDDLSSAVAMMKWYEEGAKIENYPEFQKDDNRWVPLVIITPEKKIFRYERSPVPYEIEQKFYAFGSGRDFAIGALSMGATARQAVEITCQWDAGCGNGIDELTLCS